VRDDYLNKKCEHLTRLRKAALENKNSVRSVWIEWGLKMEAEGKTVLWNGLDYISDLSSSVCIVEERNAA